MTIKWYQILFQIINFGILVFVLNRFLYKPIITIIDQRNKKIQDSIKAAEATLKEKAKIEEIKKQVIQEAEKEAMAVIGKARKQASTTSKGIIESAKQAAEQEVDKKLQLMKEQLAQEEGRIKARITDLVIKTTSQVLKDSLTDKEQHLIIDKEIKKLSKALK